MRRYRRAQKTADALKAPNELPVHFAHSDQPSASYRLSEAFSSVPSVNRYGGAFNGKRDSAFQYVADDVRSLRHHIWVRYCLHVIQCVQCVVNDCGRDF